MIVEIAKVYRGDKVESIHHGIAALVNYSDTKKEAKTLFSLGDDNFACYTRSIIKPIQAQVCFDLGLEDLEEELLAIACASHRASEEQIKVVRSLLSKAGLSEKDLSCGEAKGKNTDPIYHNCSGKHAAMLAASKLKGWDLSSYIDLEHPLQQQIINELKRIMPELEIKTATDGCGMPTFYMTIKEMGELFARLAFDDKYKKAFAAMNKYPDLIAGEGLIDSVLMKGFPGKFIAKGGAEGLMLILNLELSQALVLKVMDGAYRPKAAATVALMEKLKWIPEGSIKIDKSIYSSHKEKVGYIESPIVNMSLN